MKTATTLAALLGLGLANPKFDLNDKEWEDYKQSFDKSYASVESEQPHRSTYFQNKEMIIDHNKRYAQGLVSYSLELNTFSDRLPEEIEAFHGIKYVDDSSSTAPGSPQIHLNSKAALPESVDWRTKNVVTSVKKQVFCGSCWAFSTAGSIESHHAIKTGKLVSLSEQQLVDCSRSYGNYGCHGGLMNNSFLYVKENGGIESEASYPYTDKEGRCSFNKTKVAAKVKGFVVIEKYSEADLQDAVAFIGPVSVAIDAVFQFIHYKSGIINYPNCNSSALNHAVVVIGYDVEDGTPYWLIKNSYGTNWGYSGYGKMIRNNNNHCGIATLASYPVV